MTLLITSLLFINIIFLFVIGIGGVSMASVEGVDAPWLYKILPLWITANLSYVFYTTYLIKSRKDDKKSVAIKRSISSSAWLAFPGGIVIFMFFGSKIPWVAIIIPLIQIIIAIFVYQKTKIQ